jgi:hypothetical protein
MFDVPIKEPLMLCEITSEVFVLKYEICSMEWEKESWDYYGRKSGGGTVMTLKNGRKI